MTEWLKASVIIPTYNRCTVLIKVLQRYGAQTISKDRFELVIVDDGGSDDTQSLFINVNLLGSVLKDNDSLKRYVDRIESVRCGDFRIGSASTGDPIFLRYVRIKKSGRSMARNIGVSVAQNPLVIFADDDIFVEPEFVKKHIEVHKPGDMIVVTGKVIHTDNLEDPLSARWKPKDINTSFLATGNASVLKKHIVQAGLFDENYRMYGWEDFDLGIHLEQNGLESIKKKIFGYHFEPPHKAIRPEPIYGKERERGFTAVYLYRNHPLKWVKRFTLVNSWFLDAVFRFLGRENWFLKRDEIVKLKGLLRLIIRYKGYFDGVREGKKQYMHEARMERGR
jgi:glycosyltransferase involved in cell wall biosynthesis